MPERTVEPAVQPQADAGRHHRPACGNFVERVRRVLRPRGALTPRGTLSRACRTPLRKSRSASLPDRLPDASGGLCDAKLSRAPRPGPEPRVAHASRGEVSQGSARRRTPAAAARRLVRRWLAVFVFASLALCSIGAPVHAQTVTLISNASQGNDSQAGDTRTRAQLFTTGTNAAGYTLASVEIVSKDAQSDDVTVSVCETDSSGHPTSTCTALTAPSSFAAGTLSFTAPDNTTLSAGTTYAVQIVSPGDDNLLLGATTSNDEDAGGADDWTIGDGYVLKIGDSWFSISSAALRITINGEAKGGSSNNAPVFDPDTATRTIAENTAADTNIGAVIPEATDADSGDTLMYSMEGTDAASFGFDESTRQLKTKAALDHEAKSSYTVTIKASDGTDSDTMTVTINVTDVDEPPAAPGAPGVTATSGSTTSLDVSWTAPANTGKPAITSYDLQYRVGSSGSFTAGPQDVTTTSSAIAGLTAGTTYEVQVRATNAEGDGPWSPSGEGSTGSASNNAPTVANAIPNQDATVGVDFSYAFPANTFADADSDTLSYTATLSDDSDLPSWLGFTAGTRTFAGNPQAADAGTLSVKVTADDGNGGTVSDTFDIAVAASTAGICGRTVAVQNAILAQISGIDNCAAVTATHLAALTSVLNLSESSLTSLQAGDFDGLTALTQLFLFRNSLSTLPSGIFDNLTKLTSLDLHRNSLTALPSGIFDQNTELKSLTLERNSLSALPSDIFDQNTKLTTLSLENNTGAPFKPAANAGADRTVTAGAAVTLAGAATGPWGDNVTWQWTQVDGASSNTAVTGGVTLTGADSASASFTAPAAAATLHFRLVATPVPGADSASGRVASAPDWVTVTVEEPAGICGRTLAVQTKILERISGVSDCAAVTDTHLAAIDGTLSITRRGLTSLKAGDFDGLTALPSLYLSNNNLTALPSGLFDENTALTGLWLGDNRLASLPSGIFDENTALTTLWLQNNFLASLPSGVFDQNTALTSLRLDTNSLAALPSDIFDENTALNTLFLADNPGAPFRPVANAGADRRVATGATVTLAGAATGPWGDNVTWQWTQVDGASSNTAVTGGLTLTGADSASASFTAPDAAATLYFRLIAAPVPGADSTQGRVASEPDWVTVTVTAGPTLVSATVDGVTLVLTYDEALNEASTPAADAFTVSGEGSLLLTPSTVVVSGRTVTLTLPSAVAHGQRVLLQYNVPSANPIEDAAGNDAQGLTNQVVTNNTEDTTAPALVSATVNGATLVLTYDEDLDTNSTPAASAYAVTVAGSPRSLAASDPVTVSGRAVTLALSSVVTSGQAVTVSYTAPSNNPVQDATGNDAQSLTGQAVTNSTAAATGAPAISGIGAVGRTATATRGTIADANGLPATFPDDYTFQWVRVDGTTETDIDGATGHTYRLGAADSGNKVRVRVSFTDGGGTEETLTSAPFPAATFGVGSSCPASRIPGRETVWTGTVGVGAIMPASHVVAYGFSAGTGSLDDPTVDVDGDGADDYTVTSFGVLSDRPLGGATPGSLSIVLDNALTAAHRADLRVHVCGDSFAFSEAAVSSGNYVWASAALDWSEVSSRTVRISTSRANAPATGAPAVLGVAAVGRTLTASTAGIADRDGLADAEYAFQWIRVDADGASNPEEIAGATARRYGLIAADRGKKVMVRVRFTDDGGNAEALTSAAFPAGTQTVGAAVPDPDVPDIWSATVTVGDVGDGDGEYGYAFDLLPEGGAITDDAFEIDGTEHTVTAVTYTNNAALYIEMAPALPDGLFVETTYSGVKHCQRFSDTTFHVANSSYQFTGSAPAGFDISAVGRTFDIRIARGTAGCGALSTDASLASLALTEGAGATAVALSPAFAADTAEGYVAWVGNAVSSVTVAAQATDGGAAVSLAGGRARGAAVRERVGLSPGANTVELRVAAEDGTTTRTYTVTVVREAGPPASDPMALLNAHLTAGMSGTDTGYRMGSGTGAMTDTDFVYNGRTWTFTSFRQVGEQSLNVCFASAEETPSEAVRAGLEIVVDSHRLAFADWTADGATCFSYRIDGMDTQFDPWTLGHVATVKVKRSGSNATGAPSISGSGRVGQTLTAVTSGIADPNGLSRVSYDYRWLRMEGDRETPVGLDAATYTPVAADVGKEIKVRVSFTDDAGNMERLTSAAVAIRAATPPATCPAFSLPSDHTQIWTGTVTVAALVFGETQGHGYSTSFTPGGELSDTDFEIGSDSYTVNGAYVDAIDNAPVPMGALAFSPDRELTGAQAAALRLHVCGESYAFADANYLSASQTYFWNASLDWSGLVGSTRDLVLTWAGNAPAHGKPTIAGIEAVGGTLLASVTGIGDANGVAGAAFAYQWLRVEGGFETEIPGATRTGYTPTEEDAGKALRVRVDFVDDAGRTESVKSDPTGTIAGDGEVITIAPDRARVGASDRVVYTLRRTGATTAAAAVTVTLAGPEGNDWGLDAAKSTRTVTFAAGESEKTETFWLRGILPGNTGFQDVAARRDGVLTATLGAATGYGTSDTAEVFVVASRNPSWIVRMTDPAPRIGEGEGARAMVIEAYAVSPEIPAPSPELGRSWRFNLITSPGTAAKVSDYEAVSVNKDFQNAAFRADANGILRARISLDLSVVQDAEHEGDEDFSFTISNAPALRTGVVGGEGPDGTVSTRIRLSHTITIVDDDAGIVTDGVTVISRPSLKSVDTLAAPDTYANTDRIRFQVRFTHPVEVGGAPHFEFTLGSDTKEAAYIGGGGTDTLVFQYEVASADTDTDGISIGDQDTTVKLDTGEYIRRADTGQDADLDHDAPGALSGHKVDGSMESPGGRTTVDGTARVGQTLTANTSEIRDTDGLTGVTYAYTWFRVDGGDETAIPGATGATYVPMVADIGKALKVKLAFTDDNGNAETRDGDPTALVVANTAPAFTSTARTVQENPADGTAVGEPLEATDTTDGDTVTFLAGLGGADKDAFEFDEATGQITTKAGVTYDYETRASYTVTVTATDGTDETVAEIAIGLENLPAVSIGAFPDRVMLAMQYLTVSLTSDVAPGEDVHVPWTLTPDHEWFAEKSGTASYVIRDGEWDPPISAQVAASPPLRNGNVTVALDAPPLGANYELGAATSKTIAVVAADPLVTVRAKAPRHEAAEDDGTVTVTLVAETIADAPKPLPEVSYLAAWSLTPGTAVAGGDYTDATGSVEFLGGDFTQTGNRWTLEKTIQVTLTDDSTAESTERFQVTLTESGATPLYDVANADGTLCRDNAAGVNCGAGVTILDDDRTAGTWGAPRNLEAEPGGDTSIELSWTAPTGTGLEPITGYRVEWSADGSTNWQVETDNTGSTATRFTATAGLVSATTRYYRVSAVNEPTAGSPMAGCGRTSPRPPPRTARRRSRPGSRRPRRPPRRAPRRRPSTLPGPRRPTPAPRRSRATGSSGRPTAATPGRRSRPTSARRRGATAMPGSTPGPPGTTGCGRSTTAAPASPRTPRATPAPTRCARWRSRRRSTPTATRSRSRSTRRSTRPRRTRRRRRGSP